MISKSRFYTQVSWWHTDSHGRQNLEWIISKGKQNSEINQNVDDGVCDVFVVIQVNNQFPVKVTFTTCGWNLTQGRIIPDLIRSPGLAFSPLLCINVVIH